jgi:hypothetical protein
MINKDEFRHVSTRWRDLDGSARESLVKQSLPAPFELVSASRGASVIVTYPGTSIGHEGHLLMAAEAQLQESLMEPLEVYCQPTPDQNKFRRILQRQMEWDSRRAKVKGDA